MMVHDGERVSIHLSEYIQSTYYISMTVDMFIIVIKKEFKGIQTYIHSR